MHVPLYKTRPSQCGYYSDRQAQYLLIDPDSPHPEALYAQALSMGFRRSGEQLYRPQCAGCQACVPYRLAVNAFQPRRNQKRCWRHNQDLTVRIRPASYDADIFALYQDYLQARHRGAGMDNPGPDDFEHFLLSAWSTTHFVLFYRNKTLLAVAVTDDAGDALSAVYTFYDPAQAHRSLGTFAILQQIHLAQKLKRRYLYLGYWIQHHPKMDYKAHFTPAEILTAAGWVPFAHRQSAAS